MAVTYDLTGRCAFVTGGASGIGLAAAERLRAGGAELAELDREAAPGDWLALEGDISSSSDVDAAVGRVEAELGRIDILVNSAGVPGESMRTADMPDEEWRHVMGVNADGTFYVCRAVVPGMVERIPLGRTGTPEEVAALICWLASDECTFSTGAVYDISGGRAVY